MTPRARSPRRAPDGTCPLTEPFAILLETAWPDFQRQLDPGDPVTYARGLQIAPPTPGPRRVLIQKGVGDAIVANALTEALSRASGLAAQQPDASPVGTALVAPPE